MEEQLLWLLHVLIEGPQDGLGRSPYVLCPRVCDPLEVHRPVDDVRNIVGAELVLHPVDVLHASLERRNALRKHLLCAGRNPIVVPAGKVIKAFVEEILELLLVARVAQKLHRTHACVLLNALKIGIVVGADGMRQLNEGEFRENVRRDEEWPTLNGSQLGVIHRA